MTNELSKQPVPDRAEHQAFFPSPYSLSVYTSKVTDFSGYTELAPYKGPAKKILVVCSDERYVLTKNGSFFSTGNHPVETLLPMMHLAHAGFTLKVATLSGNPVKLELWAMPTEDQAVMSYYESILPQFKEPARLSDIIDEVTTPESDYVGAFFPGGHAALVGLPFSLDVKRVLTWAMKEEKALISLCHGPAAFLAASVEEKPEDFLFKGFSMEVFPDALDEGANQDIGYMPGRLQWLLAEKLEKLGVKILNSDITGAVHVDRNVITGDSPLAANKLGLVASEELLRRMKA
jgi:molecular chaperone Hsp31 and glyoxalase 3